MHSHFKQWVRPALVFLALSLPGVAAAEPFTESAFRAAQEADKTILVDVYADWCVTCRRQQQILGELFQEPRFAEVVRLQVNFDKPGDALKLLKVNSRSTLIVFKGARETGRSSFDTDRNRIRDLLAGGL